MKWLFALASVAIIVFVALNLHDRYEIYKALEPVRQAEQQHQKELDVIGAQMEAEAKKQDVAKAAAAQNFDSKIREQCTEFYAAYKDFRPDMKGTDNAIVKAMIVARKKFPSSWYPNDCREIEHMPVELDQWLVQQGAK